MPGGEADLTLKLTKSEDLDSLWGEWIKVEKNKKAVEDAEEFTLALETSALKLDGKTMTLPAELAEITSINVIFQNAFAEAKKPLVFDASSLTDKVLTITLPDTDAAFELQLNTGKAYSTLTSAGETVLSYLTLKNDKEVYATTIEDGITVKAYIPGGYAVLKGEVIEAVAPESEATCTKDGIAITNVKKDGKAYNVWNVVAKNNITIKETSETTAANKAKAVIKKITIESDKAVTLSGSPAVEEIVGAKEDKCTVKVSEDGLENVTKVSTATIDATTVTVSGTTFASTTIKGTIKTEDINSLAGVTVNDGVEIGVADTEFTFTFDGVAFANGATVKLGETSWLSPIYDKDGNQVVEQTYWYIENGETIDNVSKEDIPAANLLADPNGGTLWDANDPIPLYEDKDGKEANIVIAFNGGTYNKKALTAAAVETIAKATATDSEKETDAKPVPNIEVNGQLYKWYKRSDNSEWILVTTK